MNFSDFFGKQKSRGLDLNSLLIGLKNLTFTIKFVKKGIRNDIFAKFDKINSLIVTKMSTIM
jgi:hypothetical protein